MAEINNPIRKNWSGISNQLSIFSTFIIIILVVFLFSFFKSDNSNRQEKTGKYNEKYAVYALDIPEELDFAGEKVPIENFDVRESFDRELLINTYWQSQTLLFIKKANRYFPLIEPILKKNGIPDDFKYLALAESGLTHAISPARAVGFWQFIEGTAKEFGLEINEEVDERYNIVKSTQAACRYLNKSYSLYENWTLVAASYDGGRAGISRQISRQKEENYYDLLFGEETGRYVFRILAIKEIMSDPEKYGFYFREKDLYPVIPTYEVLIDSSVTDFANFAKYFSINYKILKLFNPWLRDKYLTNSENKQYIINIPEMKFRNINSLNDYSLTDE